MVPCNPTEVISSGHLGALSNRSAIPVRTTPALWGGQKIIEGKEHCGGQMHLRKAGVQKSGIYFFNLEYSQSLFSVNV